MAESVDWRRAVLRITGLQSVGKPQGTGFVVRQDDEVSLVVTCWHVVKTIGKEHLRIKSKPCRLVSKDGDDTLDLAVLSVSGLSPVEPLNLVCRGRPGLPDAIYGYGPEGRRLEGTLGQETSWPHAEGDDLASWDYYLDEEVGAFERIKDGYSGSPVYDPAARHVVAVVTHRVGENKGFAIDVRELERVYPQAEAWLREPVRASRSVSPETVEQPIDSGSLRHLPEKFIVAFSFAGEERGLVRAVAGTVEARLGKETVFLDEWFEHYLAGSDADLKLQEIYGKRCELVVICVSEKYGGKPWALAEHEAIRARLMQARASPDERDRDRILPIRVGDGNVKGIHLTTIVPDVRSRTPDAIADLVLARLEVVLGVRQSPPGNGLDEALDSLRPEVSSIETPTFSMPGTSAARECPKPERAPPSIRDDALAEIEDTLNLLPPLREVLSHAMTEGTSETAHSLAERLCAPDADAFQDALLYFKDALDDIQTAIRRNRVDAAPLREGAAYIFGWMLVTTVLDGYEHEAAPAVQAWRGDERVALQIPFGRSHCVELLSARWLQRQARFGVMRYSWCTGEDDLMDRPLGELGFDHPGGRDSRRLVDAIWKLLHRKLWPDEPLPQQITADMRTRIGTRMDRKRHDRDKKHRRWFRLVVDSRDIQHSAFSADALRAIASEIPLLQLIVVGAGQDEGAAHGIFLLPPGELAAEIDECLERIDLLS